MELQQNITKNKAYQFVLFDFDGTLISKMDINYNNMKKRIKKLLDMGERETLTPMFEIIREKSNTGEKLQECFDLIDKCELYALKQCKVNEDVLKLYLSSNPKIIITRNGRKVIEEFCLIYEVPYPDVLACRDNCQNLKPNLDHLSPILEKYPSFEKTCRSNIAIIGDSWHDEKLADKLNCMFIKIEWS